MLSPPAHFKDLFDDVQLAWVIRIGMLVHLADLSGTYQWKRSSSIKMTFYYRYYISFARQIYTQKNPLSFRNPRVRQKHNGTASDLHKLKCHLNIDEPMNLFTNNQMHAHSLTSTHHTTVYTSIRRDMYLPFIGGEQFVVNGSEQMNERKKEVMHLITRTHTHACVPMIYIFGKLLNFHNSRMSNRWYQSKMSAWMVNLIFRTTTH